MVLGLIAAIIIAFFSMFIPGLLLAFALLRKTELHLFEIITIGFIFGLIAPATLTWAESYLISYIHAFTFSVALFEINALVLSIIGIILCYMQGVLGDALSFVNKFTGKKTEPQPAMNDSASIMKKRWWVWAILLALMLITFYTRMQSIVTAPKFFEFDPYFDMIDTHYILTYGHQLLLDPSAWPVVAAGTNHRLQPIVPYLEAFWYNLVNGLQYHNKAFSTSLMSYVGGVYPPITAALLVFVIFVLLYHEYDERIGLIGAALTATMPVLLTTFIAGEQLVEPWGIFALFFFFATYMLAIRNKKDKRLAILAGIAFASNFLGAHYYTVTAGVLVVYILAEGLIEVLRKESLKDFYIMNIIVIAVIVLFYALYAPYQATLQSNLSSILGIPIIIAAPIFAIVLIAILDLVPKLLAKNKILIKETNWKTNLGFIVVVLAVILVIVLFTSIGDPIRSYIELSARFTTPSKPLFMTVQEYIPTGIFYNFGAQGFGALGSNVLGVPILVLLISIVAFALICISIIFRRSTTGVLYLAIALPLMFAGFSEVKYLPHFGVAYIMLFCIILGEVLYLAEDNFKFVMKTSETKTEHFGSNIYKDHPLAVQAVLIVGLFFVGGLVFALAALAFIIITKYVIQKSTEKHNSTLIVICVILAIFSFSSSAFLFGEGGSIVNAISAQIIYASNPNTACTILSNQGNSLGYNTYCNTIPAYWLNAMTWIKNNVGPNAPRVLAWWDYGDWINWFGNSNAVLRGDNSVATEDYAVAAEYVLGSKYNYTPQSLAQYMNGNQTEYVLFDQDLISKWGALDFLGCVHINATSESYALEQGKTNNPPQPYVLGTSPCELEHDPEFILLPLSTLVQSNQSQQSISDYCSISNSKVTYISGYLVVGSSLANSTVCVNSNASTSGIFNVYSTNGTKINAVIQASQYLGVENIQGTLFVEFLMMYLPNGPNNTITDAPSQFYNSNYYKGFILGDLPGFQQVYPLNGTGINYVNGTYPVRIYKVLNYTGGNAPVPPKDSWINNTDIMP